MSDYLFRMIERASGTAVAPAPQPPREFHWPVVPDASAVFSLPRKLYTMDHARNGPVENPLFFPEAGRRFSLFTEPKPFTTRSESEARRKKFGAGLGEESASGESLTNVSAILDGETHENERRLIPGNPRLSSEVATQPAPRTEEMRGTEIPKSSRGAIISAPQIEETAEPFARSNSPSPQVQSTVQILPPVPVPAASARVPSAARTSETFPARQSTPSRNPAAKSTRENAEPAVEVKIGRVEVRFDAPIAPASLKRPSRPSGFAEFAALRRYETQPWPSGNR